MPYLLDTDVVSELRKGARADSGVLAWFRAVPSDDLFLSVLTIGEIRCGIEGLRRRDPTAALSLDRWLAQLVSTFQDRVLPIDRLVADEWGRLNVPRSVPDVDGLLAATARVHELVVVTRNVKHYARTGAEVHNPFAV